MRHAYETSQWVPYPPEAVFAFFANPANLPPLMPAWQAARVEHAQIVTPDLPLGEADGSVIAGADTILTITFRAFPILPLRLTWIAKITEFVWNDHFCDEQTSGPLAYWKHCHFIQPETHDGLPGSLVTDKVTYALPLGRLGDLAHALAIRRQMKATFAFRQKKLLELLPARMPHGM